MSVDELPPNRKEKLSSAVISSKIAYKASLSAVIQSVTEVRPGNISRYHNFNNFKIENYLKYAVTLNQPIIDMTTRGIMVERGFIDFDEVDMGWTLSEAIKQHPVSHGYDHYVGMLLTYTPIATAAGYLISENNQEDIKYNEIQKLTDKFLENTTPEDADNLYIALYDLNMKRYKFINEFSETKIEGSNYMLEEEINLQDFYSLFKDKSLIFAEMHNKYNFCFNEGLNAFAEAIQEKTSFPDAITHTFLHVLANNTTHFHNNPNDPLIGHRIKKRAQEIIEEGGYLTDEGKLLTNNFDEYILNYDYPLELNEIAELTATISFIALMREKSLFK